jgi:hypothetical protein
MPRFHFDIREGPRTFLDAEGGEFDGLEAAERHAVCLAGEKTRNLAPKASSHMILIDVRDERKQRVMTVTVLVAVERVAPGPPDAEGQLPNPWIA